MSLPNGDAASQAGGFNYASTGQLAMSGMNAISFGGGGGGVNGAARSNHGSARQAGDSGRRGGGSEAIANPNAGFGGNSSGRKPSYPTISPAVSARAKQAQAAVDFRTQRELQADIDAVRQLKM